MDKEEEFEKRARFYLESMTLNIDPDRKIVLSQHECNKAYHHYNIGAKIALESYKSSLKKAIEEEIKNCTVESAKRLNFGLNKALALIETVKI